MQDKNKTKSELIAELEELRKILKNIPHNKADYEKKRMYELQNHFSNILEGTGIGISLLSAKLQILAFNSQMQEWFPNINIKNHPYCYKLLFEPTKNKPCLNCPSIKTLQDGKSHKIITETLKNGKYTFFSFISSPIKDETGKVIAIVETINDITEEKKAEKTLKESEKKYKALFDNMKSGIAVYDVVGDGEDFIFKDFNKAGEIIDNDKKENLIGKSIFDARPGVKDFGLIDILKRVWKTGNPESFPIKQYKDNRISGWYDNYIFKLPSGEVAAVFDNITEKKKAEEALKISEERFRKLIKSVTDYIYTVKISNGKQISTLHSPGCFNITGYTSDEFERDEKLWFEIIHESDANEVRNKIESILKGDESILFFEHRIIHRNGSIRWIRNTPVIQRDNEGKITAYDGLISDITERKKAEQEIINLNKELEKRVDERTAELAASNHELEAFSYSVSHDLKSPLRIIMGFSQLLLEECGLVENEKIKGYLQKINISIKRMSLLIEDLLNLSRITKSEMYKTTFDLSDISKSIMKDLQNQYPDRDVQFVSHEKIPIKADPNLIRIAMKNLLENSWKYTANKKSRAIIELGIIKQNDNPVCFIKDNGVGFDMAYANKLFIPFQRLHTPNEYEGTGIGLAIVQRIISKHGGQIWVDSKEGKGTTVFFTL